MVFATSSRPDVATWASRSLYALARCANVFALCISLLAWMVCIDHVAAVPSSGVGGRLAYTPADILRVCGDGESLLHAMQYSIVKRQRTVKDGSSVPDEVVEVTKHARPVSLFAPTTLHYPPRSDQCCVCHVVRSFLLRKEN